MSRSRNIKPDFFKNEILVDLDPIHRLLFIATWCFADKKGYFEDRPQKIKMEFFPADDYDVDAGLQALHDKGFVRRYLVDGNAYCQVLTFGKHQNPHHREKESTIPVPESPGSAEGKPEACPKTPSGLPQTSPAQAVLIPDSLIPDSLIPDSLIPSSRALEQQAARSSGGHADRFEEFWAAYPVKKGRAHALKTWASKKLDAIADTILADVKKRSVEDRQWLEGYAPHGSTYINGRGWEDAIEPTRRGAGQHGVAAVKPRANDSFDNKKYVGTPLSAIPPELRVGLQEAMERAHAA